MQIAVVGAGIAGLVGAADLARAGHTVTLVDAAPRAGGVIHTERHQGFVIEGGPESLLRTRPEALELVRELGLESEVITPLPAARHVFIAHRGRLEPFPAGMVLAVPTRLGPLLGTPLVSTRGKLRAALEPLVPRRTADDDESIASFFERRLGPELAEVIAAPLLAGVHSGDARELSLGATFPQIAALERQHGSLTRGFFAQAPDRGLGFVRWLLRGAREVPSPFFSLKGGLGTLVDALVARLPSGALRLSTRVASVTRDGARWRVGLEGGASLTVDRVLVAAPARVAATLLDDPELARELSGVPYASTVTVALAFDRHALRHPLVGSGFIVPEREGRLLASTWISSKWAGRAPEGQVLLRGYLGGAREPQVARTVSDAELVDVTLRELARWLGPLGEPHLTRVFRHVDARPQPVLGHVARVARLDARVAALPGLELTGGAYRGSGIPDCIRDARAAARRLCE